MFITTDGKCILVFWTPEPVIWPLLFSAKRKPLGYWWGIGLSHLMFTINFALLDLISGSAGPNTGFEFGQWYKPSEYSNCEYSE